MELNFSSRGGVDMGDILMCQLAIRCQARQVMYYTLNAMVELLPHSDCVGANLTAP